MKVKMRTYRFTTDTIKQIDYLANQMHRSRNSMIAWLVYQEYQRQLKRAERIQIQSERTF